jgi:hypothetical protein
LEPKELHATAVNRIGKYLMDDKDKGMILNPQEALIRMLCGRADIDPGTAKSRTAFIISYGGCLGLEVANGSGTQFYRS